MKPIPCVIDILGSKDESLWMITLSSQDASETALHLSALHNGIVPTIRFQDIRRKDTLAITPLALLLDNRTIPVTPVWLDTLLALFLRVAVYGWTDTAHLDGTFSDECGEISVTVTIIP